MLIGFMLGDEAWDRAFLAGLEEGLRAFGVPLLGGDTVKGAGVRALGLTAVSRSAHAPARGGAKAGDGLWVAGVIGDARAWADRGTEWRRAGGTAPRLQAAATDAGGRGARSGRMSMR